MLGHSLHSGILHGGCTNTDIVCGQWPPQFIVVRSHNKFELDLFCGFKPSLIVAKGHNISESRETRSCPELETRISTELETRMRTYKFVGSILQEELQMSAPIYNKQMVATIEEPLVTSTSVQNGGRTSEATAMVEKKSQVKNQPQMQLQHNRNLQKTKAE